MLSSNSCRSSKLRTNNQAIANRVGVPSQGTSALFYRPLFFVCPRKMASSSAQCADEGIKKCGSAQNQLSIRAMRGNERSFARTVSFSYQDAVFQLSGSSTCIPTKQKLSRWYAFPIRIQLNAYWLSDYEIKGSSWNQINH